MIPQIRRVAAAFILGFIVVTAGLVYWQVIRAGAIAREGGDPRRIDQIGDALIKDPGKPLVNRATQGLYPPGSTYKIITASAALDSGVVKPQDRFRCVNGVVIQGFVIGCENAPPGQTEWDF